MATVVGEAFLAASLEVLLEKIVSGEFGELFRSTKLDAALLGKLEITLVSLQAVLHDAEEKQITNPAVKQWLDMIRDAVFEAGDLFDEINTEALRRRVEAEYETRSATAQNSNSKQVRFSRKLTNFPFSVMLRLLSSYSLCDTDTIPFALRRYFPLQFLKPSIIIFCRSRKLIWNLMDTLESDTELWLATLGTTPLDVNIPISYIKDDKCCVEFIIYMASQPK
ncbi:hypothetical protein P8452_24517 [Trifolium repens]|nr:hypothetical protein P8452_24517 [Trifolium repens]